MDKKLKAKWVKALRSGKYEQGGLVLRHENAYCCLGVLRHINDPKDNESSDIEPGAMLSDKQLKRFGFGPRTAEKLADMNDEGISFNEIADYIERNL